MATPILAKKIRHLKDPYKAKRIAKIVKDTTEWAEKKEKVTKASSKRNSSKMKTSKNSYWKQKKKFCAKELVIHFGAVNLRNYKEKMPKETS